MNAEARLAELGYELPPASPPKARYIPVRQTGNLLFVSGQIPMLGDELLFIGKAGGERTLAEAEEAARICAINVLGALKAHLGDLGRIRQIVKLQVFVSSAPGFYLQHIVANAASELLAEVMGEPGGHARTAVSVNQLPLNVTVEIEAIAEYE